MNVADYIERWKRKRAIRFLTRSSPTRLEEMGEAKLEPVFRAAVANSPAYRELVVGHAGEIPSVHSAADFRERLPLLSKSSYFSAYSLAELAGERRSRIKLAMTSSGFSGEFGYAVVPDEPVSRERFAVDVSFDYCFNISEKKTFVISFVPMGVHLETSLTLAETSVRSDMVIALLEKVSPYYDQTILIGDPYFSKKLIEEGDTAGIDWSGLRISLVIGQDWLPETLRSYLADRLAIDISADSERMILATMGMAELGLNQFHESFATVRLRREFSKNRDLRALFPGADMTAPPYFFHYYPFRTWVENVGAAGGNELAFTSLNADNIIPLLRYTTGDRGRVIPLVDVRAALGARFSELMPDLKLPICMMMGRTQNRIVVNDTKACLEDIKEALFLDRKVASAITGLFQLKVGADVAALRVHLKPNVSPSTGLAKRIETVIGDFCGVSLAVRTERYEDFKEALTLNFERKLYLPVG